MKRITALILAFLLLSGTAFAIEIDDLSLDELIALKTKIEGRISQIAGDKKLKVPIGIYKVGTDIPAGVYSVKLVGGIFAYFTVGESLRAVDVDLPSGMEMLSDDSSIGKIELFDGQYVKVQLGTVLFEVYKGLSFE